MIPRDLVRRWREDAETFERYHDAQLAVVCRRHAEELERSLLSVDDELLDVESAARLSGYSRSRITHMLLDGIVPNAGGKGRPLIRRADLPYKPGRAKFDPRPAILKLTGTDDA